MNNVTDFLAYRESKKKIENFLSSADVSKLGHSELAQLVQMLGKLVEQQSNVLNAVMVDMTMLVQRHTEMQQQFVYVSGQAYLALQFLKDKGIATPEEVETAWQQMVQEKILRPQGLEDTSPENSATEESLDSTESD